MYPPFNVAAPATLRVEPIVVAPVAVKAPATVEEESERKPGVVRYEPLKVRFAEAPNEPELLNCICVFAPATVLPEPPWSGAQMTSPNASVVSLPPLP